MKYTENDGLPKVLVVDDEPMICETLQGLLESWQMRADTCPHPSHVLSVSESRPEYDVILLDVHFQDGNGLDFLPQIQTRFPSVKVIMVTGYADKNTAIQALKLGAFDFIEKPFDYSILKHAIERALDAKRKEDRLRALLEELRENERLLTEQNRRLEFLNEQLLKTNKAMAVLAQNIAREREETERRIAIQLRGVIMPLVGRLALNARTADKAAELEAAMQQIIDELTSGDALSGRIVSTLSFTELRVATLIKSGLTTEEIARQLHVSLSTVKTHRRNIRRKLNLADTKTDLRSYLATCREGLKE
ncbi:MAG: response regulator [Desulfosoma sp.]